MDGLSVTMQTQEEPMRATMLAMVLAIAVAGGAGGQTQPEPLASCAAPAARENPEIERRSVYVPMNDGVRLAVDVEFGRGRTLFALSQGFWAGEFEGAPAEPNTGALVRINGDGTITTVLDGLNQPTSLEIIENTAYVVTLGGEIWTIDNIAAPPFGRDASGNPKATGNREGTDK